MNDLESRRERYFRLSTQLAQTDGAELAVLDGLGPAGGWGRSQAVKVGSEQVFVKRVPITEQEAEDLLATRNGYGLPTFYNYGVGSMGLGVGRELAMHLKTTDWVLSGEHERFPLMYHYRVMPMAGERGLVNVEWHRNYVVYWAGDERIGRYALDRAEATHELVLCLEHLPIVLENWLIVNPSAFGSVLEELFGTIEFLRARGVIHFDLHYQNVMTDGQRTYLTDFGLVLDQSFTLSEEERAFFDRNALYDYARCVSGLDYFLQHWYGRLSEEARAELCGRFGVAFGAGPREEARALVGHVEELGLDAGYTAAVVRLREAFVLVSGFYSALQKNPRKDTLFPGVELERVLRAAGVL